jgi:hypothetical protein
MVLSWGTESYTEYKKEITRYKFFDDPIDQWCKDAVFGLDVQLMKLVNFFKSAAYGYGTEKRVSAPCMVQSVLQNRLLARVLEKRNRKLF